MNGTRLIPAGSLSVMAIALAASIYVDSMAPPDGAMTTAHSGDGGESSPPTFAVSAVEVPNRADFAELDDRPIFVPTRHLVPLQSPGSSTVPALAAKTPTPRPLPAALMLVGIVSGPGDRIALVRPPSSQKTIDARIGQTIEGWEVVDILPDRMVVRANSIEQTVVLAKRVDGRPTANSRPK